MGAGSYELERVELPEAGIAMELPRDWEIDLTMKERELALPSGLSDEGAISWVDLLYAEGASGDACGLELHHDPPLALWEHAEVLASAMLEDDPDGWHADVRATVVNGELGRQVDLLSERTMGVARAHIWDSGPVRFVLTCGTDLVFNRSWLSMAESVELLEGGPAPAPQPTPESADVVDDIVDVVNSWESEPFDKFVYVSETEMMRASCDRAVWIEHTDGTWAERIDCQLTLEPVDPPAVQGEIPTKALTYQGGACEWPSDYWLTGGWQRGLGRVLVDGHRARRQRDRHRDLRGRGARLHHGRGAGRGAAHGRRPAVYPARGGAGGRDRHDRSGRLDQRYRDGARGVPTPGRVR